MPTIIHNTTHVLVQWLEVPDKYQRLTKYHMIACKGRFAKQPILSCGKFVMPELYFDTNKDYEEFSRRIRVMMGEIVEVRSDTKKNYWKNRIRFQWNRFKSVIFGENHGK